MASIARGLAPFATLAKVTRYTGLPVDARRSLDLSLPRGAMRPVTAEPQAAAPDDDLALVEALARGDAGALEELYEHYSRGVYSLALHLLRNRLLAEEVVQETFLKLWRRPEGYQSQRGRLFPWLLGVAHHHAIDLLRRHQLELRHRAPEGEADESREDSLTLVESREADPLAEAGTSELRQCVRQALQSLPENQRVPLELAYYAGLTQAEIASRLGEPLGTIKTRMRLALLRLRREPQLAAFWGGE